MVRLDTVITSSVSGYQTLGDVNLARVIYNYYSILFIPLRDWSMIRMLILRGSVEELRLLCFILFGLHAGNQRRTRHDDDSRQYA